MLKVAVIMGSVNDWDIMKSACQILEDFQVPYITDVISAHRTPDKMVSFAKNAKQEGIGVIIAGAGAAAHVAGVVAGLTTIPVIGIPIKSAALNGIDSLLSIVQMPSGIPVASMAINNAKNGALFAISILALNDDALHEKLVAFRKKQTEQTLNHSDLVL